MLLMLSSANGGDTNGGDTNGDGEQQLRHPPGLDEADTASLHRLLTAHKVIEAAGAAVDACGARFMLYALAQPTAADASAGAAPIVPSAAVAWAFLSDNHVSLLQICVAERGGGKEWAALRALGVGYWLPQVRALATARRTPPATHRTPHTAHHPPVL